MYTTIESYGLGLWDYAPPPLRILRGAGIRWDMEWKMVAQSCLKNHKQR